VLLHELRAPLAAASYSLTALAGDGVSAGIAGRASADQANLLHTAQLGVSEAQNIVRWGSQLAAVANGSVRPNLQPVVVAETIRHAKALLPAAMFTLHLVPDDPACAVLADQPWLTEVCINLLENAVKHARRASIVQVEVRRQIADRILTAVTTTGSGIAADRQREIFRPYAHEASSDDLTSQGLGL